MRGYQLHGLNIADEMAHKLLFSISIHLTVLITVLAKLVKPFKFLAFYLKHYRDISGHQLVVIPKSALQI